jgi:hypothetical protein
MKNVKPSIIHEFPLPGINPGAIRIQSLRDIIMNSRASLSPLGRGLSHNPELNLYDYLSKFAQTHNLKFSIQNSKLCPGKATSSPSPSSASFSSYSALLHG